MTPRNSISGCPVIRRGFEPRTDCLEGSCSIQLSYRTIIFAGAKIAIIFEISKFSAKYFQNSLLSEPVGYVSDSSRCQKTDYCLFFSAAAARMATSSVVEGWSNFLRMKTKLRPRYFSRTIGLAASSSLVPWNRILPSKSR